MSDIRLYSNTGIYEGTTDTSEFMLTTLLSDSPTTRLETIGNKVVKFMLTSKGSDIFNPTYGSYLPTYNQIAKSYLPRFHIEILEDLSRCTRYIQKSEQLTTPGEENLLRIDLLDIRYLDTSPDRVDIYIEIITTFNNSALLTIPVKAN